MRMILHIPDAAMLASSSLDDIVNVYCQELKVSKPDVICLPLVDYGGANYDSDYIGKNVGHWALRKFGELCRQVREYHGSELYLSINAGLPFIEAKPFVVRDQYNDAKSGVCIINPGIQSLHQKVLEEAIELFEPTGVLFDLSDINGQGATDERLFVTCFCQHCLRELKHFDHRVFRSHPNPLNLVLRDVGSGIRNFDIDSRIRNASELVELSKNNRVYDEKLCGSSAKKWADIILEYVEARCRVTAQALQNIVTETKDIKYACTICSPRFDWTSGIDLAHLSGVVNEVWLETSDITAKEVETSSLNIYHLLFSKGLYTVDALFEIVSSKDLSSIARGLTSATQQVEDIIEDRIRKVVGASQFSLSNKTAIEHQGTGHGVVGIPLTEEIARKIGAGAQEIIKQAVENPLMPSGKKQVDSEEEKKQMARAVLASLAQWLEQGGTITLEVLQDVARQIES